MTDDRDSPAPETPGPVSSPPPAVAPPAFVPPAFVPPAFVPPAFVNPSVAPAPMPPTAPWAPAYPSQASGGHYPAAGYGPPGSAYPVPVGPSRTVSGRAIAVLILGIASWLVCPIIPAIVALALAPGARREITGSSGWVTGRELVTVGVVLSWVHLGLLALLALVAAGFLLVAILAGSPTPSF